MSNAQQFTAFLSHGYKSPAANLYFWSVLSEAADFQFEVDPAVMPNGDRKPTSVTRLEMLIRQSDAFIGIFTAPEVEKPEGEQKDTAYFRLETDLAIRARKPTLLFIDQRYQRLFQVPPEFRVEWFNHQEVQSRVSPNRPRFKRACEDFCDEVLAHKDYALCCRGSADPHRIAIILGAQHSAYSPRLVEELGELIAKYYAHPTVLRFPSEASSFQMQTFDSLNWCFADVGRSLYRTGLVGYLHGRFVPMMRALHAGDHAADSIADYRSLYVGIEKGYGSDLVTWDGEQALLTAVRKRLEVLTLQSTLITDSDAATQYFAGAALRKEAVFLSYSSKNHEVAMTVGRVLKSKFQNVFNYREAGMIPAGHEWREQIEEEIRNAAIGIQIVSDDYYASTNCMREAGLMDLRRLDGEMFIIPIKAQDGELRKMPDSDKLVQYLRMRDYDTTEALVAQVIKSFEKVSAALSQDKQRASAKG